MHFFRSRRAGGCFLSYFSCHTFTNTFRTQQKYRDPGSISSINSYLRRMQTYCGSFCLSDYPKHKTKCWSKWQPSYRSVLQFSLAPLVFLYFGLLCYYTITILYFIWQSSHKQPWPVSSTSAVSLFLLSEHAWPTHVTPLLISCQKFVWSRVRYVRSRPVLGFSIYVL